VRRLTAALAVERKELERKRERERQRGQHGERELHRGP
jgi:hypothetical protein